MYAIRCSKKLLDRGVPRVAESSEPPTTVLGDWYANVVIGRSAQLVVCISEGSLLPVIVAAKDLKSLPERIALAAEKILLEIGVEAQEVATEVEKMRDTYFAKTANRRVVGTLNDFVFQIQHGTASKTEFSLHERALRLARMPCAALGYAYPCEAAIAAFVASRSLMAAKSAA